MGGLTADSSRIPGNSAEHPQVDELDGRGARPHTGIRGARPHTGIGGAHPPDEHSIFWAGWRFLTCLLVARRVFMRGPGAYV
jgi:hypothetical protein